MSPRTRPLDADLYWRSNVVDPFHQQATPGGSPPSVIEMWACRFCCWIWQSERMYCGVCGRHRSGCSACPHPLRMVVAPGTVPARFCTSAQTADLGHLS